MKMIKLYYNKTTTQFINYDDGGMPIIQGDDGQKEFHIHFDDPSVIGSYNCRVVIERPDGAKSNEIYATPITGVLGGYYKVVVSSWVAEVEGVLKITTRLKAINDNPIVFGVANIPVQFGVDPDENETITDTQYEAIMDAVDGVVDGSTPIFFDKTGTDLDSNSQRDAIVEANQKINNVKDGTTIVKKAEQDASGNVITTTYETKNDVTNKLALKADKTYVDTEISNIENGTTIVEKAKRDKNGNDIVETYETKADATSKLALKANTTYVDSKDAILQSQINGNISDIESLELSKEDKSMKGQPNGYAPLDVSGYIPSAFVPNSFDDVIEFNTYAALLAYSMPQTNKLFVVKQDETSGGNHSTYRWTGTMYIRVTDEMSAAEIKVLYESNADTNPLTDVLKNNYNEAYAHSQIVNANPHQTTYAQLLNKPTTVEELGVLNVYNKDYIDALKDKNGWESELLGTLSNNGTIALSIINQYDEIQMYAKDTLGVIDNENIRPSLMVSGDSVYFFDDTQAFIMIDTVFGFYAPVGYTLQVVGLKYTDFTAEEVSTNEVGVTVQDKLDEIDLELEQKTDKLESRQVGETIITYQNGVIVSVSSDNVVEAIEYDVNGEVEKVISTYADGKVYEETYTKDVNGNITQIMKAEVI